MKTYTLVFLAVLNIVACAKNAGDNPSPVVQAQSFDNVCPRLRGHYCRIKNEGTSKECRDLSIVQDAQSNVFFSDGSRIAIPIDGQTYYSPDEDSKDSFRGSCSNGTLFVYITSGDDAYVENLTLDKDGKTVKVVGSGYINGEERKQEKKSYHLDR